MRLTQEVAELQAHVSRLNTKLAEAEAAMKLLKNTKRELKEDLGIKALSLVIDRQKCMAIRLNFPYHTRCVCSTAKEDEAQVDFEFILFDSCHSRRKRSFILYLDFISRTLLCWGMKLTRFQRRLRPKSEFTRREELKDQK